MIYFGQDKMAEFYYGGTEIKEMYLGNTKVFQNKHPLFLTLETDGHGTLSADVLSGFEGDTVTLSPTYNTYYRFNNYSVTGGTISNNTFTFGSQNATAKANFKANSFTARGTYFSPSISQSHGSQTGNWSTVYGVLTSASQNVSTYLTSVTSTVYTYLYNTNYTNTAKSTSGWNPGANSNISAYGFTGAPSGRVRPWSQNTLNMNKRIGSTNIATQAFTAKTGTYNFAASQYTSTTKGIPNWQIKYGSKNQDQLALGGSWTATGYLP